MSLLSKVFPSIASYLDLQKQSEEEYNARQQKSRENLRSALAGAEKALSAGKAQGVGENVRSRKSHPSSVIIFLADKAVGGIVSDYAKRFWLAKVEPKILISVRFIFEKLGRGRKNLAREETLELEACATETLAEMTARIVFLEAEVTRLRIAPDNDIPEVDKAA